MNKLKRFKKLSALIASTLLTTSLFVGCGNSNVGENGTINFFNDGDYIDEALSEEEAEHGFGLACQIVPETDIIVDILASSAACKVVAETLGCLKK